MELQVRIAPQLCKTYGAKSKIEWPWFVEPKFDGLRGIVVFGKDRATAFSRNGKPLWNVEHILQELGKLPWRHYVLDGEFFTQDWNLSMSILKTQEEHPERLRIRYHVWDVIPLQAWIAGRHNTPLRRRKQVLRQGFSNLSTIDVVEHVEVAAMEQVEENYRLFIEQGYEGAILKDPESQYILGTRSPGWLKLKPWFDADLRIEYVGEGMGRHQGRLGFLGLSGQVTSPEGDILSVRTEVGTGFTDEERDNLWETHHQARLIGKIVEIKYQEITVDGSCRFPVFHRLREDKDETEL